VTASLRSYTCPVPGKLFHRHPGPVTKSEGKRKRVLNNPLLFLCEIF
jgi:hypothetical protein